jgi:hypothetical protein
VPRSAPHYLRIDVYDTDVWLATNAQQWKMLRRRLSHLDADPPESAGISHFAVFEPDDGGISTPTIALFVNIAQHHSDQALLVNTIAHEATHAAGQLLEHIGHAGIGGDEPRAYLVGHLAGWMWSACTN